VSVLHELELEDVPVAGLAKRFEEIYLPDLSDPVVLPHNSQGLYLAQRIRDEALRFAITYHRSVRGKRAMASVVDDVGLGGSRLTRC
jgi:excinuclease ABC subunit C